MSGYIERKSHSVHQIFSKKKCTTSEPTRWIIWSDILKMNMKFSFTTKDNESQGNNNIHANHFYHFVVTVLFLLWTSGISDQPFPMKVLDSSFGSALYIMFSFHRDVCGKKEYMFTCEMKSFS